MERSQGPPIVRRHGVVHLVEMGYPCWRGEHAGRCADVRLSPAQLTRAYNDPAYRDELREQAPPARGTLSDADLERIAERVAQKVLERLAQRFSELGLVG